MATDVLQLEQAQERSLQELEDAALTAEWMRAEEPGADPVLRAQRLATEAHELMLSMARLCGLYWGHGIAGAIRDVPAAIARLRQRLNRGAVTIARAVELAQAFAAAASIPVSEVDDLPHLVRRYKTWVEETMERWALLSRRPRAPDPATVARSQDEIQRGEGEDVADILARLVNGGPLIKE